VVESSRAQTERIRALLLPPATTRPSPSTGHSWPLLTARDPDAAAAAMHAHLGNVLQALQARGRARRNSFKLNTPKPSHERKFDCKDDLTTLARRLRPADLSLLGFGGAPLGNLSPPSPRSSEATLNARVGLWQPLVRHGPLLRLGPVEERFGRAPRRRPRDEWVLSTKIGRVLEDCAPEDIPEPVWDTLNCRFRFDYLTME
jgi:hypothetical protein